MSDRRHTDEPADPRRVARDLLDAGRRAQEEGRFEEAASTLRVAADLAEHNTSDASLAREVLEALVIALRRRGDGAAALATQRRLVSLYEARLPNDARFCAAVTGLAILCDASGREEEARALVARAVEMIEASGNDDPIAMAQASALGQALVEQGEHDEAAERLLQRGLAGLAEVLGEDAPEHADIQISLADLYMHTGREDEAQPLLEAAVEVLETQSIPRKGLGLALLYLGQLRMDEERAEEAAALFARGEDIYTKLCGATSAEALGCRFNRALALRDQGQREAAEALLADTLRAAEAKFGRNDEVVANIAESYADLLEDLGRADEAAALAARVSAIRATEE